MLNITMITLHFCISMKLLGQAGKDFGLYNNQYVNQSVNQSIYTVCSNLFMSQMHDSMSN